MKVATLIGYLPQSSRGLRTTLVVRVITLLLVSAGILKGMKENPLDASLQLFWIASVVAAVLTLGASPLLLRASTIVFMMPGVTIGLVNFAFAPHPFVESVEARLIYGATRGAGFIALVLVNVLICGLTRPHDVPQALEALVKSPRVLAVMTIPLTTFRRLQDDVGKMILAARTGAVTGPLRSMALVPAVAISLFVHILDEALIMFEALDSLPRSAKGSHSIFERVKLFSLWDGVLLAIFVPALVVTLWPQ